jgi:hypothetical protein
MAWNCVEDSTRVRVASMVWSGNMRREGMVKHLVLEA